MIRSILISTLFMPLTLWAKPSPSYTTQDFFKGLAVELSDDLAPDTKNENLAVQISAKIQEFGLNVMNLKEHGVKSQEEYRVRKSKSEISVLYVDITNIVNLPFDRFTFDLVYAKGSEFFIEQDLQTLEKCRGVKRQNGSIEINLKNCLNSQH